MEEGTPDEQDVRPPADDAIRDLVKRLARPRGDGGLVIERAALRAEGSDLAAIVAWIEAHGGKPEAPARRRAQGGLHGMRSAPPDPTPTRFILPAAALD